jgi:hypothetical protein
MTSSTASQSMLQSQTNLRPNNPPPQRPERPRDSVMTDLYVERAGELGIQPMFVYCNLVHSLCEHLEELILHHRKIQI